MFLIVDGDESYNNYDLLLNYVSDMVLSMTKNDKEITLFVPGPENIVMLANKLCVENPQINGKRIKYYSKPMDEIISYGITRFNYYVKLQNNSIDVEKIEGGTLIV